MSAAAKRQIVPLALSEGFRFFFLAGPVFGILAIALWMAWLAIHAAGAVMTVLPFAVPPYQWHAHEMIYGYGGAVAAGFFLTAVPNWTGAAPARAVYIASIAALWLAGRLAVFFSAELPGALVMVVDVVFIPILGLKILQNLMSRPKPQNMLFLLLLVLLTIGNSLVHIGWLGSLEDGAAAGNRLGLLTLSALIAILGGRVTPAFTRNALNRGDSGVRLPVSHPRLDQAGIASAIALAMIVPLDLGDRLTGSIALIAGFTNAARLAGWRGIAVLDQPILWSLHLGFAFLVLGYLALAAHWLGAPLGEAAAFHLLAIGAVGGMTLAVMSRAALGHTGRRLVVGRPIALAYGLLAVAALTRAFGVAIAPDYYFTVIFASGTLWIAAFSIFAAIYVPILLRPRADVKS
ncbi:MAG: NnrS family protein [Hyphomicrobiaceae bacterium]|nr:NnrS family protein [Hyphomicrobiaceae bacterium]